jgi:hypothetical protein
MALPPCLKLHRIGHTSAIGRITLGEQRDLPALDLVGYTLHCCGDVVEKAKSLFGAERAKQVPSLRVVVIAVPVVIPIGRAAQR